MAHSIVHSEIDYTVKDPKHRFEKPYDMRYDTGGVIPRTNLESETIAVSIEDFRPRFSSQNFHDYGFTVVNIGHDLTAAVFDEDRHSFKRKCYPAVEKVLWARFSEAAGVYIVDHNVGDLSSELF